MVLALVLAAIAAIFVVWTTVMALRRSGEKDDAQAELIRAKDRQLALDLGGKDVKIAEAQRGVAEANERAESERLQRVQIQSLVSARHIPPENIQTLTDSLRRFKGKSVILASYTNDPESFGLTRSILAALTAVPISVQDVSGRQMAVGQAVVGIGITGPRAEQDFVETLGKSIGTAGRLQGVSNFELPDGSPVTITVGVKPPFWFNDPK